jgi:hypothetical protein
VGQTPITRPHSPATRSRTTVCVCLVAHVAPGQRALCVAVHHFGTRCRTSAKCDEGSPGKLVLTFSLVEAETSRLVRKVALMAVLLIAALLQATGVCHRIRPSHSCALALFATS